MFADGKEQSALGDLLLVKKVRLLEAVNSLLSLISYLKVFCLDTLLFYPG